MLDWIRETFSSVDWDGLFEHVSNENLVALFTHPYGLVILGVLFLLSMLLKWRIMFVAISGALAIGLLMRYVLVGEQMGPNKTLLPFAAGAVVIAAFAIYWLFIREE